MIRRVDDADRHRSAVDRLGSVGSGSRLGRAYIVRSRLLYLLIGLSWQTCACEAGSPMWQRPVDSQVRCALVTIFLLAIGGVVATRRARTHSYCIWRVLACLLMTSKLPCAWVHCGH